MADTIRKNVGKPDELREISKGKLEVVKLGELVFGRATFQPGWKWSNDVKPVAKTPSCQVHHNGYIVSGHMTIRMDDGKETQLGPGDVFVCPPGHDAWITGNEPCVALDFAGGAATYAKPA
jgi:mannose-6-phosphate isomerase-like protein (cupin superfamily)